MSSERTMELVRTTIPLALSTVGSAVASLKKVNVRSITLTNVAGTPQTVRLRSGPSVYIVYDYVLAAGQTINFSGLLAVLAATEQFSASTTTANGVSLIITGIEEDA